VQVPASNHGGQLVGIIMDRQRVSEITADRSLDRWLRDARDPGVPTVLALARGRPAALLDRG
jgi:hypothetical protein